MVGLPVITSAWSGQYGFLSDTDSMLLVVNYQKYQITALERHNHT